MSTRFGNGSWAVILGGSSGFGLATAHKLAEHGMKPVPRAPRPPRALARIEPEFEKLRGHGVQLLTLNADALDAEQARRDPRPARDGDGRGRPRARAAALDRLRQPEAARRREAAPAPPRRCARARSRARSASTRERLVAAADELFAQGLDELHAVASPPQYPARAFLDDEDFARTIHSMGTSLLDWTQDLHARGLFASDARVFGLTSEGNTRRVEGLRGGRRREGRARVGGARDRGRVRALRRALQRDPGGGHRDARARRDPRQRACSRPRRGCAIRSAGSPRRATSRTSSTCSRSTTPPGSTAR